MFFQSFHVYFKSKTVQDRPNEPIQAKAFDFLLTQYSLLFFKSHIHTHTGYICKFSVLLVSKLQTHKTALNKSVFSNKGIYLIPRLKVGKGPNLFGSKPQQR